MTHRFRFPKLLSLAAALFGLLTATDAAAHSGKARFHIVIDTDAAADDLRTLCMLLGNREAEVLAVTTSEGALTPAEAALRVGALLDGFYHPGVPVGEGRAVGTPAPAWRAHSRTIGWGDTSVVNGTCLPAAELIARTLENEEEKVVFVALGALTNLSDALRRNPSLGDRIERVVWYDGGPEPLAGDNFRTDTVAARHILQSGIRTAVVTTHPSHPIVITPALLDSIANISTPYAEKIVSTHRSAPLAELIQKRHLRAWDDLAAVYLFRPELFVAQAVSPSVDICTLPDEASAEQARQTLLSVLRGKPDSESRVFYGFPLWAECYAADVAPLIGPAVERHGPSEWRAGVLTNELHGHLGIYATVGVKMGIRAREYFNIGVDDIRVTSYAGLIPPISCMNDGLQTATGATLGHGLIAVAENETPRPEALFTFKDKTIRLTLKPEYAERIRRDVKKGIDRYGDLTEDYWQYIRELALSYWVAFDRHEMFDLHVER